jgi:hypothetical protein
MYIKECIVKYLNAYVKSEDYTRSLLFNLKQNIVMIHDKDLLNKGFVGFCWEPLDVYRVNYCRYPYSDTLNLLQIYVNSDYFLQDSDEYYIEIDYVKLDYIGLGCNTLENSILDFETRNNVFVYPKGYEEPVRNCILRVEKFGDISSISHKNCKFRITDISCVAYDMIVKGVRVTRGEINKSSLSLSTQMFIESAGDFSVYYDCLIDSICYNYVLSIYRNYGYLMYELRESYKLFITQFSNQEECEFYQNLKGITHIICDIGGMGAGGLGESGDTILSLLTEYKSKICNHVPSEIARTHLVLQLTISDAQVYADLLTQRSVIESMFSDYYSEIIIDD